MPTANGRTTWDLSRAGKRFEDRRRASSRRSSAVGGRRSPSGAASLRYSGRREAADVQGLHGGNSVPTPSSALAALPPRCSLSGVRLRRFLGSRQRRPRARPEPRRGRCGRGGVTSDEPSGVYTPPDGHAAPHAERCRSSSGAPDIVTAAVVAGPRQQRRTPWRGLPHRDHGHRHLGGRQPRARLPRATR